MLTEYTKLGSSSEEAWFGKLGPILYHTVSSTNNDKGYAACFATSHLATEEVINELFFKPVSLRHRFNKNSVKSKDFAEMKVK